MAIKLFTRLATISIIWGALIALNFAQIDGGDIRDSSNGNTIELNTVTNLETGAITGGVIGFQSGWAYTDEMNAAVINRAAIKRSLIRHRVGR